MFRPGLISNVIWNVISNCLSHSGFELNFCFSFAVVFFPDTHIGNIMIVSQLTMTLHKEQRLKAGRAKIEKPVFAFFEGRHTTNRTFDLGSKSPSDAWLGLQMAQLGSTVGS